MTLKELKILWNKEKKSYHFHEVGSGVQLFVKKVLQCKEIFNLFEGNLSTKDIERQNEFLEEHTKKQKRADIVIFITNEIIIPVEVEKTGNIIAGEEQLFQYQLVWDKKNGILTDGNEWVFYISKTPIKRFYIEELLENNSEFITFWNEYVNPLNYYLNFFKTNHTEDNLNIESNRQNFYSDITTLISNFKNKLNIKGYFDIINKEESTKQAIEISYAYLIQFILYKTLVDNNFTQFKDDFDNRIKRIQKNLETETFGDILTVTKAISELVSQNIYKPFKQEQNIINEKLNQYLLNSNNSLIEVTPWLDIFVFIKRYDFSNLKNEIFGFIYENFLKQLYNENLGQYFTAPQIVDFMLNEIGFNNENLLKKINNNNISIIDPSCGGGTFLYSAVRNIIENMPNGSLEASKKIEKLISENIFGIDIAEFPLYLAEMNIIMRMLPLIINEKYNNVLEKKIKVFKTKDTIAEFLDTAICNTKYDIEKEEKKKRQLSFDFNNLSLGYKSYVRDSDDLDGLKRSLENDNNLKINRFRFDFVIGNPPYISYKECTQRNFLSFQTMKEKKLTLSNVYGVNLHSVPNNPKKYAPNPNLYAFFIAVGLALLKDNGVLCYIIPQTLLTAGDLDVLRYHLSKFTTIQKIIIFSSKLFINRGLKQKKEVITSSLIIKVKKQIPDKNHLVEIENYTDENAVISEVFNSDKITSKIEQKQLLKDVLNWNYIQFDDVFKNIYKKYNENVDIKEYYNHSIANEKYGSLFYFDRGLKYPKSEISDKETLEKRFFLSKKEKNKILLKPEKEYITANLLNFPFGSQGIEVYEQKYKIVWSYMNFDKFRFADFPIMIDYNHVLISSNNLDEILYLLALLNSIVNKYIFNHLLKLKHEQDVLIGIKTIKDFIKVPYINSENINIKNKIINLTKKILEVEKITLSNNVNFNDVLIQKFDSISIVEDNLLLFFQNKVTKCKINDNIEIVKQTIENYNDKLFLSNIKIASCIDYEKIKILTQEIDNMIFLLYFDVKYIDFLSESENGKYYQYIFN